MHYLHIPNTHIKNSNMRSTSTPKYTLLQRLVISKEWIAVAGLNFNPAFFFLLSKAFSRASFYFLVCEPRDFSTLAPNREQVFKNLMASYVFFLENLNWDTDWESRETKLTVPRETSL